MKWKIHFLCSFLLLVTNSTTGSEDNLNLLQLDDVQDGDIKEENDLRCKSRSSAMLSKPVYRDLWGYPVNWTDPADGWDQDMRKSLLDLTNSIVTQSASLANYTQNGYTKMLIPSELYQLLLKERQPQKLKWEDCRPSPYTNCMAISTSGQHVLNYNTQVMGITDEQLVRRSLVKHLKPILEDWCQKKLSKEVVIYGIRRYLKGAWLSLHVDKLPTHIISVILQIDQKVNEEWPLTVIDHKKDRAKVFLKPGEMLLYESAKMPHGRQFPFNGDYFDNLFVHFHLK